MKRRLVQACAGAAVAFGLWSGPAWAGVTVDDVSKAEGDSGTTSFTFTISGFPSVSGGSCSIYYSTSDGTAMSTTDYQPNIIGTTTTSETSAQVSVPVIGDGAQEPDETFFLNLMNVFCTDGVTTAAVDIDEPQGQATILDDDGPQDPCDEAGAIRGTAGNDVLRGSDGPDVICGLGGDDTISGYGGEDTLHGGAGKDTVYGGGGENVLDGGEGPDKLYGGAHDDGLSGGAGADQLSAGAGNDTLADGEGNDTLLGYAGSDTLISGAGDDVLRGGDGADTLSGEGDQDRLYGEAGNDGLDGGMGDDLCVQGAGTGVLTACEA